MHRLESLARCITLALVAATFTFFSAGPASAEPLKIAYSDWPGWVAWEIGIQKGWFEDAGVDVEFVWMDYVASMDAYAGGQVDAVTMTNGDALVTGATGKPSVGIIINDFSNGNDKIVGGPGISSIADLKGKKVGVEIGFVCHLLLLKGLEAAGMTEADVELVNMSTNDAAQTLASGDVAAIGAWQPNSGQALAEVAGSSEIFTSADAPGIIYDLLYVSPESLKAQRDDWMKVVGVWYQIVDYLQDPANMDEALEILSARVEITPEEYRPFFGGTKILTLDEALEVWEDAEGFGSVYGSSVIADKFNVDNAVYEKPQDTDAYLDPSLTEDYADSK